MTEAATDFPVVPDLHWSDELHTGDARMDETHEEFVRMLADLRALPAEAQLPLYRELTAHTEAHFAQEDRWMLATGFTADNCHSLQHKSILDTMRAVETHYLQGDLDIISRMADALAEWFPMHARSMDAGLAQHMRSLGFDTHTETLPDPSRVRPASMSGCGSITCSD
ncbi:hemerythrin domain-containing protein [Tepidicella xavieri]|uniref:Hemerythrin-like metal-binding protein n=1 Tax=Tepidicella xavieri TaxID=360241 RepID=A0A4R6UFP5_9BURK|nr:hemerythrin domain-containing protein [Tepidicella xavieri]TDQ41954.1 hemerythrin-like metal-binding protein [Tepidicella xavieri]